MFDNEHTTKLKAINNFISHLQDVEKFDKHSAEHIIDSVYPFIFLIRKKLIKNKSIKRKSLLDLIENLFHMLRKHHILTIGHAHEINLLDQSITETDAYCFYSENLVERPSKDLHGNRFSFPEPRHNHYYKNDGASSRKADENHEVNSANFKVHRARRMPLLKPIIQSTPLTFKHVTLNKYMHIAFVRIELKNATHTFYQIIISEWNKKEKQLDFVTSYHVDNALGVYTKLIDFSYLTGPVL